MYLQVDYDLRKAEVIAVDISGQQNKTELHRFNHGVQFNIKVRICLWPPKVAYFILRASLGPAAASAQIPSIYLEISLSPSH